MNKKIIAYGVLIALVVLGVWRIASRPTSPTMPTNEILTVRDIDHKKGNERASVTLIEYLDFECEACGAYYLTVKELSTIYEADLQVIARYFPLPGHKNSSTSARAAEAAARQGKFWEMHNLLFDRQKDWGEKPQSDPTIFENYAQELGLDMETFRRDVNSDDVKSRVELDRKMGASLGIDSTPTFFLNGELLSNPRNSREFELLIQQAISSSNE